MNKNELIAAMAKEAKLTKKDSEAALNAFIESVAEAVSKKDKVTLVGFGTWEVRERAARKGVNPKTKEAISIPATKVPAFKSGKLGVRGGTEPKTAIIFTKSVNLF